jgi:hypothetical protein
MGRGPKRVRGPRLKGTPRPSWERLDVCYLEGQPSLVLEPHVNLEGRADPMAPMQGHRRNPSPEARAIVSRMSGYGFSVTQISKLTGYRPSTLYRSFREELTTSAIAKDLDVLESAYHQAVGGPEKNFRLADPSMTRLWLGHRLGWKAPTAFQDPNKVEVDLDRLSDDELHDLDRILSAASDKGPGTGGSEA